MIRSPHLIDTRVHDLSDRLRERGLSVTHQRIAVYRSLLEDDTHPDADRLYERVRVLVPTISLGTVYKALDTLKDLGAIMEVDAPRSATRYEAVLEPHHHLVCDPCGAIIDLHAPAYSKLRPPARAAGGFRVTGCTVQFRGTCPKCASRQTKPKKHSPARRSRGTPLQGG